MRDPGVFIHPTTVIEEGAIIGARVHVGPFCYIGSQVEIGEGTFLKSHVVVNGITRIGKENQIFQFASIGEVNQDLKYAGEATRVEIGDRNRIRESVTVHRGTVQGTGITLIGDDNLLMVNTHIAHDCVIANHCILANNVTLGGHVTIDDYAIIGGMTALHQYCIVGSHVMIGGASALTQDVPPYVVAQGNYAAPHGINTVGLRRRGFTPEALSRIRNAYNILYRQGKMLEEAKKELVELAKQQPEVQLVVDFLTRSTRGIIR